MKLKTKRTIVAVISAILAVTMLVMAVMTGMMMQVSTWSLVCAIIVFTGMPFVLWFVADEIIKEFGE